MVALEDAWYYESEFQEVLLDHSKKQYSIDDTIMLLRYLFRRFIIVQLNKNNLPRILEHEFPFHFMKFWLNDIAIPVHENTFVYKGVLFSSYASHGSPLKNIFDDLLYQLSKDQILSGKELNGLNEFKEAQKDVAFWLKQIKTKNRKYSKNHVYPYVLKRDLLNVLNDTFKASVKFPTRVDGVFYQDVITKIPDEEVCNRYYLAFHELVTDGKLLSESELEKYVIRHLDNIESGLRYLDSQYLLPKGRIDVLARDQNGALVIIELKVEKDTDVLWQKWYYTKEIKKRFSTENVRFMVILPEFYEEIVEPLLSDNTPTKILQYHPFIQRGKLTKVDFTPYQKEVVNNL